MQQSYTPPAKPADEAARIHALHALEVLDSAPEADLDALVEAASQLCLTPISVISLIDSDRQWFRARVGLEATQTPRDVSFCGHTILQDGIFEVSDALFDPRFSGNPLVTGEPRIRFYAGFPIALEGGEKIGTLCVIDHSPRHLTETQRQVLKNLARVAAGIVTQKSLVRQMAQWREEVQAAKTTEGKYEALVSAMSEGVVVQQANGTIVTCNASAERHLGLSYAQMVGLRSVDPSWRCVHEDMSPWPGEAHPSMMALASGKEVRDAVMGVYKPDGTLTWISVNARPVFDNGMAKPTSVISTFADITERRQHEEEALRSSNLLHGAIEAIDEAFVVFDPQDRFVLCNQKYRQDFALSAELMVPGITFETIIRTGAERGLYSEAVGRVEAWLEQRMVAHRSGNATVVQRLQDGRTVRIVERRMPDGHTVGFRFDITELVRATEDAQEASRSKSNFLATMSHEIRTPMNAILGMLSLLQQTELTDRQRDYASKAQGAAQSLLGLLNDILDFSKVEAGKLELESLPFRLDTLMRNLSVVLSANVGGKNVEVLYDIDAGLPAVLLGDAMRLQQVLINLGSNAVKFTSDGQVTVVVRQVDRDAENVHIEFQVQDSGIGIAPEHQALIFSGFSQAEASTTRRFGGTGLGLAISQRLVALMGSDIQLSSTQGVGSNFYFTVKFPVVQQNAPLRESTTGQPALAPCAVLVVDDNPIAGELTLKMVRSWGWSAQWAGSGAQAMEWVRRDMRDGMAQFPFPVIFMDWQMPEMDGWETTRQMRALAANMQVAPPKVIMLTAHGRDNLAHRSTAEQDMLSGFLVKPVSASMLFDALMDASSGNSSIRRAATGRSSKRRLAGMRVLLVEDNLINQQVADELLSAEGAIVSLAANGKLGVEAVASAAPQFDVVLMDIQMPVLDGYGATRQIREELGLRQLPIVAMTANAMTSDREVCLDAGMNEHIGKPFDLAKLVSLLIRMTGFHADDALSDIPDESSPSPEPNLPVPEVAGLEIQTALNRMSGMRSLYVRTAKDFVKILDTAVSELQHCLITDDKQQAMMRLHTLKGNAGTLGAMEMAVQAAALEKLCKASAGMAECEVALAQFALLVQDTQGKMREAIALLGAQDAAQRPAATETPSKTDVSDAARQALHTIASLAKAANLEVLQSFAEARGLLAEFPVESFEALDEALQNLDLEAASSICDQMLLSLNG